MTRAKHTSRLSVKPIAYGAASLLAGIALLIFSQLAKPKPAADADDATATAPASSSAPDAPPASQTPPDEPEPDQRDRAAQNLSGVLLLFSMCGFALFAVCVGWLVRDIRRARPAWKKQTKYPRMR
jgi:hypothetical protein